MAWFGDMAIRNLTADEFSAVLKENLTPSATIKTPERLFGRQRALTQIERALASEGRQIFIYGDRGVGKTSLALTAANLLNDTSAEPIYVLCGSHETFAKVMKAVGDQVTDVSERFESGGTGHEFGGSIGGIGATFKGGQKRRVEIPLPSALNDALDIVRYVLARRAGRIVIVIDEMERMPPDEREKFAELIKNIPELDSRVRFIFCGISNTVNELIGTHPSVGRILETIELEKLHHDSLWAIIEAVSRKTGIAVEREALIRISQISDGFPHYVHLIGESMFWSAFDDEEFVDKILPSHFRAGIAGAIQRAEAILRAQYERATMKTKNTGDYEEALWALADRTSDKRQLSEIYDSSYKRIMIGRRGRTMLEREKLNQRLLTLRKESHGRIVVGYGSGWFGFRENIVRGYVRLRAEAQGIELGKTSPLNV